MINLAYITTPFIQVINLLTGIMWP